MDVPALDGVAFIDAKSSELDIVQAVGRAIRLSAKEEMGTIVIPVFIERHDNPEEAVASSNFKPIWDVLDALKAHDDVLSNQLDQLRIELGAGRRSKVGEEDLSKIVFDLPTKVGADFAEALHAQLVAKTTESWMFWYGLLQAFVKKHGHCRVPQRHFEGDFNLGQWVGMQRGDKETMLPERKRLLDEEGFVWDEREEAWNEAFAALMTFKQREGHCRVRRAHSEGDFKLGRWVIHQRTRKETMPFEWRRRLEEGGFVWNKHQDTWERGFDALLRFKQREGHCNVPGTHKEENFNLGNWVTQQRVQKETMPPERRSRLEGEGFSWRRREERWEEGFAALMRFKKREGHSRVPQEHFEEDFDLGTWVTNQRVLGEKMLPALKQRLNEQGFVWHTLEDAWERGFEALLRFKQREGHCLVPYGHREEGFRLGAWVTKQRGNRHNMSAERKKRLNEQGFVWGVLQDAWERGYNALVTFKQREGHCRVPISHFENGFNLGSWVSVQRLKKQKVPPELRLRLDGLGFVWRPRQETWEHGIAALIKFKQREGHCRVPQQHKEGDFNLGIWVRTQRRLKNNLSADRRERLDEHNFFGPDGSDYLEPSR